MTKDLSYTEQQITPFTLHFPQLTARYMLLYLFFEELMRTPLTLNQLEGTVLFMLFELSPTNLLFAMLYCTVKKFLGTLLLMLLFLLIKKSLFTIKAVIWLFLDIIGNEYSFIFEGVSFCSRNKVQELLDSASLDVQ